MIFADVQAYFAARITGDTALALLGVPISVDPFSDPEAAKTAISAQLRATGVCIEVGFPWIATPDTSLDGSTHVDATCELFIAESIQGAHTPAKAALVTKVIQACTKPQVVPGQKPARLRSSESVKTEGGYILHMMSFFVPLNIKQP